MPTQLRVLSPLSFFLVFCLVIFLSGCTQSIQSVNAGSRDAVALHAVASDKGVGETQMADKSVDELVQSGWFHLAGQNLTLASLHFVMAVKKDPVRSDAYLGLGRVEQEKGNAESALANYRKAEELQPNEVAALIGQAQIMRLTGRMERAEEILVRAGIIELDNIWVLMERAVIYDLTGRETLAEPLYREILKRAPDQAASHNNLGLNQLVQGRYSKAAVSFHKALELDPTRARIRNNLATAYAMLGDEVSALDLFTETIGKAGAYNNLGYLYMTQGKLEDAERTLRMAMELNPRFYKRAQENLDRVERMKSARHTP